MMGFRRQRYISLQIAKTSTNSSTDGENILLFLNSLNIFAKSLLVWLSLLWL